jgi:hypothetical protein
LVYFVVVLRLHDRLGIVCYLDQLVVLLFLLTLILKCLEETELVADEKLLLLA